MRLAPGLGFAWLFVAACAGGQSGTETPHPTPPAFPDAQVTDNGHAIDGGKNVEITSAMQACACVATDGSVLLHAALQSIDACSGRARVREVLSPASPALAPGDVVGGTVIRFGTCLRGLSLVVGDDVLLVYTRGTQDGESCPEYAQCIEAQCAKQPEPPRDGGADCFAGCVQDTRAACAAHADEAQLGGQLLIARYGDPLVFGYAGGSAITLPQQQIDRLLDPAACNAWFVQQAIDGGADDASVPQCVP